MNTNNLMKNQTASNAKPSRTPVPCGARPSQPKSRSKEAKARTLRPKAPSPAATQPADVIKVGLDMGLKKYLVCRQVDNSLQEPPRAFKPESFKAWLVQQKSTAQRVVVCYEAGLFGFELARWVIDQGMECVVMAPVKLDEANKRVETDQLNARDIAGRLDRYLAGNTRALTACRIPSREEELARHETRQRQQLLAARKALEAQGRCLLWQFGYLDEGSSWWEERGWKSIVQRVEAKVVQGLERQRAVIAAINQQLDGLMGELEKQAASALPEGLKELPLGMGWLSVLILTREIMDWKRFKNRRQIGSFSGLVPSEASTGQSVRQGSITKVGNPMVRMILVEMAWRMVRYQPHCRAVKPWYGILCDRKGSARVRKRAIVAVARILAVDLWRLATGQTTAAQLGFVMPAVKES